MAFRGTTFIDIALATSPLHQVTFGPRSAPRGKLKRRDYCFDGGILQPRIPLSERFHSFFLSHRRSNDIPYHLFLSRIIGNVKSFFNNPSISRLIPATSADWIATSSSSR